VRTLPGILRAAAALSLAAGLAILLAACATLVVKDDLPRDAEKGWVIFVSNERLPLRVSRVAGGAATGAFGNRTARGTPVAVACPPGLGEFALEDGDQPARVAVPVARGMVTYVGVRRQVIAGQPPTEYATRISVGTHPLPIDAKNRDPAPLVTALADRDWATRWAAVKALDRMPLPLEPAATPLLTALAREDPYAAVRTAARRTLESAGKPSPAEPLAFLSFEQSADGWPLGEGLSSVTSLAPEGYLLQVRDTGATAWRSIGAGDAVSSKADFDVLVECRWVGGIETAAYGLTLGSGPATFNAFGVARNGGATVLRYTEGRYRSSPLPWQFSAAAAITGTPVSRIEVSKRGARYALVVNGEAAGSFTDGTGLAVDRIGVFADSAQSVVFRKIVVTTP
jgi:hypothetical protein